MAATIKLQAKNDTKSGIREFISDVAKAEAKMDSAAAKAKKLSEESKKLDATKKSLGDRFKELGGPVSSFASGLGLSQAGIAGNTSALGGFGLALAATVGSVYAWGEVWKQSGQNFRLAAAELERDKDLMKGMEQQFSPLTQKIYAIGKAGVDSFKAFGRQIGLLKEDLSALDEQMDRENSKRAGAAINQTNKQFQERRVAAGEAGLETQKADDQLAVNIANQAGRRMTYEERSAALKERLKKLSEQEVRNGDQHFEVLRAIARTQAELADTEASRVGQQDRLKALGESLKNAYRDQVLQQQVSKATAGDMLRFLEKEDASLKGAKLTEEQLANIERERSVLVAAIVSQQQAVRDLLQEINATTALDVEQQKVKKLTLDEVNQKLQAQKELLEEAAKGEGLTAEQMKKVSAERAQLEARREELRSKAEEAAKLADDQQQQRIEAQIARKRELLQIEETASMRDEARIKELKKEEAALVALRKDRFKTEQEAADKTYKTIAEGLQKEKAMQDEVLAKMRELVGGGKAGGADNAAAQAMGQMQKQLDDPAALRKAIAKNRMADGMSRKDAFASANRDLKKGTVDDEELARARSDLGEQQLKTMAGTGKVSGETISTMRKMLQEHIKTVQTQEKMAEQLKELRAANDALGRSRSADAGRL